MQKVNKLSTQNMAEEGRAAVNPEVEKPVEETGETRLVRWAVEHGLITEEMNLLRFLNSAGWKTIEEMREFCEQDMPPDVPQRFRTRILNAVRKLRNQEDEPAPPPPPPPVVVHHYHHVAVAEPNISYSDLRYLYAFGRLNRSRLGW